MLTSKLGVIASLFCLAATVTSCGYKTTESGLEYKILSDSSSEDYPEMGGAIEFLMQIRTNDERDSVIFDQTNRQRPLQYLISEPTYKPSIEEGLQLLTAGDSAEFLVDADSLYAKSFEAPLPTYLKSGDKVKILVKLTKVYDKTFVDSIMAVQRKQYEEYMAQQAVLEKATYSKDSVLIQDYLKKNNAKAKAIATVGGAYIIITKANPVGKPYVDGDTVKAHYKGTMLESGKVFDESKDAPFQFILNQQQVIKGWDECFSKLKRGEKAVLLIPSRIAYGQRGANGIPPGTALKFEVEALQ
ncbi:MAG: FKBP-type peptidyl-prolyl cis-trans isomerase [Cytophagaceae bacterium]|jgi:FKBP-type peptidyl-prolyl cis-trans isomerase|nr:FKBP-type peptidyl-prolyl cis-trans isomerase [Cytophagaceae bacterium]